MTEPAICTEQLIRDFGTLRAVDNISFEVAAGTVFGFLGPNGAGKTTMIRLLLGLLEPTSGRAEVLGFDTRSRAGEVRLRTGALLEFSGIYERLSAEDNLEFYGKVWHLPVTERRSRIKELLSHMGLWERRKELAGKWSRGMKQKLAIARVLMHHPQLIFLDEPTAGLDPVAAAALRDDIAALAHREGVTVFLTTHNLNEAEKLCSQVGVIREGRLLAVGNPDDLRSRKGSMHLEVIGHGFDERLLASIQAQPQVAGAILQNSHLLINLREESESTPLIKLIMDSGAGIDEVRRERASLEEVFLTLMEEEK